ncbi:MAG: cytoplasmic protein [Phycisphaerae bacterium]
MTDKVVLLAFKGEMMCFVHVLLNALDMKQRDIDVKIILEGAATAQVAELADEEAEFADLYARVREAGLIDSVCQACAHKMGSLSAAKEQGLPIVADMSGHPPIGSYVREGYQVITF